MALTPAVARQRFAAFVERALRQARQRGLTDRDIRQATGVQPSTFHKWRSGEGGLPKIDRVNAFVDGLEIPRAAAYAALGIEETRRSTAEPPLDPDLRRLARILADPNVPEANKQAIRYNIRALAAAARAEREPADD